MTNEITALSSGKFIATESGLVVNGAPTFDEWMTYGKMLHRINRALQMVIGDWLNEGEKRYGETYAQATALWPEAQLQTLANWKWVSGAVESSLRRENLHFSHYAEVAALPEEEQNNWLEVASTEKLTSRQLHDAIHPKPAPDAADRLAAMCQRNVTECAALMADDGLAIDWRGRVMLLSKLCKETLEELEERTTT